MASTDAMPVDETLVCTNVLVNVRFQSAAILAEIVAVDGPVRTFRISPDVLSLLAWTCSVRTIDSVRGYMRGRGMTAAESDQVIAELFDAKLLTDGADANPMVDIWLDNGWRHALMFHLATSHQTYVDIGPEDPWQAKAEQISEYRLKEPLPDLYSDFGSYVMLPEPSAAGRAGNASGLALTRRTTRRFGLSAPSFQQISDIFWYSCSHARSLREEIARSAPRDGAVVLMSRYSAFEIYLSLTKVDGIADGVYHYAMQRHGLHLVVPGDWSARMGTIAIGQAAARARVCALLVTRFDRYQWRYRHPRAWRSLHMDAGALCQRIVMAALAVGVKSFQTPALRDQSAEELLGVDGFGESVAYLVALGLGGSRA